MARLIEELKKLPGVGTKSAQRYAFHILRSSDDDANALAEAVRGLKASLRLCSICNNVTDIDPCAYCASPTRNQRLVCVVEEPTNIAAVERSQSTRASTTCCMGRSRRCMAWDRTSCARTLSVARNAAKWTK
jgi:recombination protein RecR